MGYTLMLKSHRTKPNDSIFSIVLLYFTLRFLNLGNLGCDGVGWPNLIVIFQILPNIKYRANDITYNPNHNDIMITV